MASPGGSNEQLQFNDGGAFGGVAGSIFDKTAESLGLTFNGPSCGFEVNPADGPNSTDLIVSPMSISLAVLGAGSIELQDSSINPVIETTNDSKLGFFNTPPVAKPTVTGAKGGNAALTSLLTKLANLGLITDSTT